MVNLDEVEKAYPGTIDKLTVHRECHACGHKDSIKPSVIMPAEIGEELPRELARAILDSPEISQAIRENKPKMLGVIEWMAGSNFQGVYGSSLSFCTKCENYWEE